MNKDAQKIIGWLTVLFVGIASLFIWVTWEQESAGGTSVPAEPETETPTPTEPPVKIVFENEIPVAVAFTATPTETPAPTATPTVTPTIAPTATEMPKKPTNTPKPTNTTPPTPKAQNTAKYEKGTPGTRKAETNGKHGYKPWARHTAVTNKKSRQYKLEQVATTDDLGRRIVKDPNGEFRYLVALPVYWAGGTEQDIGRCVDITMVNGAVLKCVLADVKKIENSQNGEGKYGEAGEIIEVICEQSKLIAAVRNGGDASKFGKDWEGDVKSITAYDLFIDF